jgi:hypothetical protein
MNQGDISARTAYGVKRSSDDRIREMIRIKEQKDQVAKVLEQIKNLGD